jgi:signal peptidase I
VSLAAAGSFTAIVEQTLAGGVGVRFKASGGSMHPSIRDGETIAAAPVAASDVVCGDILLYRCRGRLLAHRVVEILDRDGVRMLRTRGDAKTACDAPVAAGDVLGRVTTVTRGARHVRLDGRAARLRHRLRALAVEARIWITAPIVRPGRHATISAA